MNNMFKIECLVDERKLGQALRGLAAVGAMNVTPTPVVNAVAKGGKVSGIVRNGNMPAAIAESISKRAMKEITVKELKAIIVELGFSINSYSHVLYKLQDMKVLKATSTTGKYKVL